MKELTKRQKEIFDYILSYYEENQIPPTILEIRSHFNFSSNQGVVDHLKALEKKGYIERQGKARGIILKRKPASFQILGEIAAGNPVVANDIPDVESFNLDNYFEKELTYALTVKGDSMINAGINNGDIVFIKYQETLNNGEIGVAILNGEATVKRFFFKEHCITLQPENKDYEPIIVTENEDFRIAGKVIGLFRNNVQ